MEGRSRLLVFDNCEHVLDAAADLIETILTHSSTVRFWPPAAKGLRVADEQLWPVPSLDVHTGVDSAAATLFIERAQRRGAGASRLSDRRERGAVVEICRRLDGIPLAIELAASRMQSMTVTEVRDRLDDRFRLLVGSRRGLERHQTLRHAVQWSYDLLDDAEKDAAQPLLGVRRRIRPRAARARSPASGDEFATLDLLDALVRKSLLVADRSSGRTRFSMLETIRQFAEEQLVASGEADDVRTAHARYFAGREADVLALWDSPRQREAYTWFTSSWRICALRSDGRPTTTISTPPPLSPSMRRFSDPGSSSMNPVAWAEELIEPAQGRRTPTAGTALCDGRAVLRGRSDSTTQSPTPRPACRRSKADAYDARAI